MPTEPAGRRRRSRLGLFLPVLLLGLVAAGWSVAWFLVRERVTAGLDSWLAAEAGAGRRWSCPDRSVSGFPFRIELACSSLALSRPDLSASAGRLLVVAQVYQPRHVIAELAGPVVAISGPHRIEAVWTRLRASVVASGNRLERSSVVVDDPTVTVESDEAAPVRVSARALETHLRPSPSRAAVWDWALSAKAAAIPGLDVLVGGTEAADLDIVLDVTAAADLPARPIAAELERWREAGGRVELTRVSLAKGPRRLEAQGVLGLDARGRPEGEVQVSAARLEGVLGGLVGRLGLAGGLVGQLLGAPRAEIRQAPARAAATDPALRPLPPLRLADGRLFVGPFPVPGVTLPPLY